ncbi:MAG TPA: hypothetical protein HA362_07745 [Nanoarchaeota archaeon]|nr:hypothetical protein [Nanoarchaeota archaeon]
MTLEDQLKKMIALEGVTDAERSLLILSGCNTEDKVKTYRGHISRIDAMFKEHLRLSGLEGSEDEKKKLYALHRFVWRRKPARHYALARLGEFLSGFALWEKGNGKYKKDIRQLAEVVDNYIAGKVQVGNCLGLTALETVLALRNGLDVGVVLSNKHIQPFAPEEGYAIESTNLYGFGVGIPKKGKKCGLSALVASAASSRAHDCSIQDKALYEDIRDFADPEYSGFYRDKKRENRSMQEITADNYYNKGLLLSEMGWQRKAIESFTKAIELDGKHFAAFTERGKAKYGLGDYAGAEQDSARCLALNPINIQALVTMGNIRYQSRDFKGAAEFYTEAIAFSVPPDPVAYGNRALAFENMGEPEKAKADLLEAEKLKDEIAAIKELKETYK